VTRSPAGAGSSFPDDSPVRQHHVLVANDDGIHAPGLRALVDAALKAGFRVSVIAPDSERSGASNSITVHDDLLVRQVQWPGVEHAWAASGTPADGTKIALHSLLSHDRPQVVLSGVNRGQNTGTCVLYSGTCGAAFEGALLGIPSIAVSLGVLWPDKAELRPGMESEAPLVSRHAPREQYAQLVNDPSQYAFAAQLAVSLIPGLIEIRAEVPWGTLFNLNVPMGATAETPIEVNRMGPSYFADQFAEQPNLNPTEAASLRPLPGDFVAIGPVRRFRNVGDQLIHATGPGPYDDIALRNGIISLVPIHFEMTGGPHLQELARKLAAGISLQTA
jgi:5'/3'-nucleotidase SurE